MTQTVDLEVIANAAGEAMWSEDHASRGLGMSLVLIAPGKAVLSITVTKAMTNGHGMCHGGFLFTLADSAFAFACNSHNTRAVAQHCNVTYVAPAEEGDVLIATATEISRAGRSGITDVVVTNQADVTIAIFRGHSRTLGGAIDPDHPST